MDQFVEPFGYSDTIASIMGGSGLISGMFGGYLCGYYVEKTLNYKKALIICSAGYLIAFIGLMGLIFL